MKRILKTILAAVLVMGMIFGLVGCGLASKVVDGLLSDMPFNGDIVFHEISMTIPESFIRDSTQSNEDLWLFESGGYEKLIILSRKDAAGDISAALDDYVAYMQQMQAESKRTTFLGTDAVVTTYTQEGMFCQEMLFSLNGSFYAVALRGGTEEEFWSLLNSVAVETEM